MESCGLVETPLHTKGRKAKNVLHDHDHFSCCGCLGGTAGPQPSSNLPDSDFLTDASWTKPTWSHFEVHWNGQKGDEQAS
ncbi:hypothetical protein HJG60_009868 [Phyllostomus discolor]|uniref:Uncharacterized protein n=1 Tax=Phyllostomus discolor TaxID=89673 RepID=A0A834ELF9_9CHIR|nr:hypothetical protein HJG60_009868 [Phyllostomus discolor]